MGSSIGMRPIAAEIFENYAVAIDYETAGTVYIGIAEIGSATTDPAWQIRRFTYTTKKLQIEFANGSDAFNQIWDGRIGLTYV